MSDDIFSKSTQSRLSDIFTGMTNGGQAINENVDHRAERRSRGEAGVQQWSRGDIFPVTIVIKGFGDSARILAKHGDWSGPEHLVNGDFQTAHSEATKDAIEYLEANQL